MTIDKIVDMVAVRHGFVTASRSMDVARLVTRAAMLRRMAIGIFGADLDHMFVNMTCMGVVQMSVMEVINVTVVTDSDVAAVRPVDMRMVCVDRVVMAAHEFILSRMMWRIV